MIEQKAYIPPAPRISSNDGRLQWEQRLGVLKVQSPALAVEPVSNGGRVGDIQRAIDSAERRGGGIVYIRNGTYTETADIIIPSSVSLIGEAFGAVVIVFAGAFSIKATGTGVYSTGTISVTSGSATVTRSGTSWLANFTPGHKIKIAGVPHEIASVNSNTSITLRSVYAGSSASGLSYLAAIFADKISIENLVVVAAAGIGMDFNYTDLLTLTNNVIPSSATNGLRIQNSARVTADTVIVDGSGSTGVSCTNTDLISFTRVQSVNSGLHGFLFSTCTKVTLLSCPADNNTQSGFDIQNGNSIGLSFCSANENVDGVMIDGCLYAQVYGGGFNANSSDGIEVRDNADKAIINGILAIGNGAYGVRVATSDVNDTIITSCQLKSNTSGGVSNSGTTTINANNQT